MGRGAIRQRSQDTGIGDITGITGSDHIVVTGGAGPTPNIASDGTDQAIPNTLAARDANAQSDFRSIEIRTALLGLRGFIDIDLGNFFEVVAGPLSNGLILESQGSLAIFRHSAGVELRASAANLQWIFGGGIARTDTFSSTSFWSEVYTAEVANYFSSFVQKNQDLPTASYTFITQQPGAAATGTNRDSGSFIIRIEPPDDESAGGRWGQTVTQWNSTADEDREYHGQIDTTDATVTSILGAQSNALPASSSATVFTKFKVRNTTTDASRTVILIMHWGRTGAGAPTQRGATVTVFDDGDAFAVTCTVVVTGNALVPQFTGILATNFHVSCEMMVSVES